jgi:hypothetical protein
MVMATQITIAAVVIASIVYLLILRTKLLQKQVGTIERARGPRLIVYGGLGITAVSCALIGAYSFAEPNSYDSLVVYGLLGVAFVGIVAGCYGVIASYRRDR